MKEKKWDFLLTADYVLLYEKGEFVVHPHKALGIKDNTIDFIGNSSPLLKAKKTYHFKNHLLCPGLINTHTHIPMSLFRGLADNIPLKQWLEEYIFPLENKFVDEDFVRVGSLLSAMELIRSGTTTFCDMYFYNQAIAQVADVSGLRGVIGVGIPTQLELDNLLKTIAQRTVKLLEKRGFIVRDQTEGDKFLNITEAEAMDQIHASSITYRIAFGKYKGQKALTLRAMPKLQKQKPFLSQYSGFSLHAGIYCPAHDRKKRERLCRYISRPSLSEERLSLNAQGQVVYKLKTTYRNGTTHIVLDPLDFFNRLLCHF